jgi:hypothetical protein
MPLAPVLLLSSLVLQLSWPDVVAQGASCEAGKADDCNALYGEAHAPEGATAATNCKKGDCNRFGEELAMDAASTELRELAIKRLADSCRGKDNSACTALDESIVEADARGWGQPKADVTAASLKAHATLLREVGTVLGPMCKGATADDKMCGPVVRLPAKAKNLDAAAEHLAKKEPVCDRPLSCAIACASDVSLACDGFKLPDYHGDFAFQLVMGMRARLQSCVGGDVGACTEWFLMVAEPEKNPKQWAGLKPDMISAVKTSCAADTTCEPAVKLLRANALSDAEAKDLDASFAKSCQAGAAEACEVSGNLARAQELRQKQFTKAPASERGLRALVAWSTAGPVTDDVLAPLDKVILEALRYCVQNHSHQDCDPMLDQPAFSKRFGDRLQAR